MGRSTRFPDEETCAGRPIFSVSSRYPNNALGEQMTELRVSKQRHRLLAQPEVLPHSRWGPGLPHASPALRPTDQPGTFSLQSKSQEAEPGSQAHFNPHHSCPQSVCQSGWDRQAHNQRATRGPPPTPNQATARVWPPSQRAPPEPAGIGTRVVCLQTLRHRNSSPGREHVKAMSGLPELCVQQGTISSKSALTN